MLPAYIIRHSYKHELCNESIDRQRLILRRARLGYAYEEG